MNKEVVLSDRLKSAARMVTPGNRVVDVGCDHGFTSIYLVQQGISPRCLAMDVRTGPLSRAREHVAEYQMDGYIETRLSDGLKEYRTDEAEAMLCCGMGGPLMCRILQDSSEKAKNFRELILQPQSEVPAFRRYLRHQGYLITDEDMVLEDGKYYFIIHAIPASVEECIQRDDSGTAVSEETQCLWDSFGRINLQRRHPVLAGYLEYRLNGLEDIERQMAGQMKERT
ncbi:MAG: SAM-dependent methyltransferase, partial [Lachnospiraceae bacterium]|nr:SAM-dependent methyltransferase [Lachnospiraceae bacterium]